MKRSLTALADAWAWKRFGYAIDYATIRAQLAKPKGFKLVSAEDRHTIALAAKHGDKRALELLVMLYNEWCLGRAKEYARTRRIKGDLVVEELAQECRMALLKSLDYWKPEVGAFTTCAHWWLLHAMGREPNSGTSCVAIPVHAWKQEGTRKLSVNALRPISLDKPVGDDDDRTLKDMLVGVTDQPMFEADDIDALQTALQQLPQRERIAIEKYYWEEKTLAEVGAEFGVTRQSAFNWIEAGMIKLKTIMGRRECLSP